jgi:hypothetical protein
MIRYSLRCAEGHAFDSWFAGADAFDALAAKGMVTCAVCGGAEVSKALMAPRVSTQEVEARATAEPATPPRGALSTPTPMERRIAALRAKVEAEATYVGPRFAAEARAIHERGEDTPIWGEAKPDEARALIEDGIAVAPLPGLPRAKAN